MAYEGSCHCGSVTFRVGADLPTSAYSCNCSHCRRRGFLLAFHPAGQFALTSGGDALVTYTFHKHQLQHRFCATCGTQSFAEGKGRDGGDVRAINLRCVPACDLDALQLQKIDGASF